MISLSTFAALCSISVIVGFVIGIGEDAAKKGGDVVEEKRCDCECCKEKTV